MSYEGYKRMRSLHIESVSSSFGTQLQASNSNFKILCWLYDGQTQRNGSKKSTSMNF